MKAEANFYAGDRAAIGPASGDLYPVATPGSHGWAEAVALEDIAKGEECELVEGGFRRKRDEADTPTEETVRFAFGQLVDAGCYWPVPSPAPYSAPNWTPVDAREPLPKKAPIKPLVQKKEPVMVEVEWKVEQDVLGYSTFLDQRVTLTGTIDGRRYSVTRLFLRKPSPAKVAKILPKMKARVIKEYRASHQTEVNEKIVAGFGGKEQIQLDD